MRHCPRCWNTRERNKVREIRWDPGSRRECQLAEARNPEEVILVR